MRVCVCVVRRKWFSFGAKEMDEKVGEQRINTHARGKKK